MYLLVLIISLEKKLNSHLHHQALYRFYKLKKPVMLYANESFARTLLACFQEYWHYAVICLQSALNHILGNSKRLAEEKDN